MTQRSTIARASSLCVGIGLHGGKDSSLQLLPAECPGSGIIFRDRLSGGEITASLTNVISTQRSTCLGAGSLRVETVEHLLSALSGLGVTDAIALYEGVELPIVDGSALPFVELIEECGLSELDEPCEELTVDQELTVSSNDGGVLTAVPSDRFWIAAMIDYSRYSAIGVQSALYDGCGYKESIAPARTYGFHHELSALREAGLGLGACLENVVALDDQGAPDVRTPLRMKNELVRHKVLDLIGDLSLSQKKLKVGIVAYRPSHSLNVRLSAKLLEHGSKSGVL